MVHVERVGIPGQDQYLHSLSTCLMTALRYLALLRNLQHVSLHALSPGTAHSQPENQIRPQWTRGAYSRGDKVQNVCCGLQASGNGPILQRFPP